MSATFKLAAKKKFSQNEIRKLMNEQKKQRQTVKIDSPLAKYNDAGQLLCILCKTVVRSEDVWKVHVNAKQHKENIIIAKQLKEKTDNFTKVPMKRPLTPPTITESVPEKKIKGILKNTVNALQAPKDNTPGDPNSSKVENGLPSDFFDSKKALFSSGKPLLPESSAFKKVDDKMDVDGKDDLPEGFFDDPVMDAKVRNLEYKDPIEEEWEKFQKEIKEEASLSNAIIAEDQEEATAEREIDEIDEQMRNWSRVLTLEKKKHEVVASTEKTKVAAAQATIKSTKSDEEADENDDEDFDEFLDWRAKKSHR